MPRSKSADDLVLKPILLRLLTAVFLLATLAYAPDRSMLSRAEYADLRDVCSEIECAADGKPYIVVGLGKSPSAFLALFRAIDRKWVRQLPLTLFDHG